MRLQQCALSRAGATPVGLLGPKNPCTWPCCVKTRCVCVCVSTCWLQLGYTASKEAFGHVWDMHISAGEGGPIFTVSATTAAPW